MDVVIALIYRVFIDAHYSYRNMAASLLRIGRLGCVKVMYTLFSCCIGNAVNKLVWTVLSVVCPFELTQKNVIQSLKIAISSASCYLNESKCKHELTF